MWVINWLRNQFLTEPAQNNIKLWIRRNSRNRIIVNFDKIYPLIKENNFDCHYLDNLHVLEQIKLFSSASVVVGAHGAGLANIIFCKPGTTVIELVNDTMQYQRKGYKRIASLCNLKYIKVVGDSIGDAELGVFRDIKINVNASFKSLVRRKYD